MKKTDLRTEMQKIQLSSTAKTRIKVACRMAEPERKPLWSMRGGVRVAVIAACVLALSISAYAAAELALFYMERDGDTVKISASLNESNTNTDTAEAPNRAWNADEGEVMVALDFGYLPEDMTPDRTANGKYSGNDVGRAMTFSGFDLRICDLNAVIGSVADAEEFAAGDKRAFLLKGDSEIAVYNKSLYILFEEEQLVIKATVGYQMIDEELKQIATELRVVETDDVSLALPIANEVGLGGDTDDNMPDVLISPNADLFREDLLSIGESAHSDYGTEHFFYDITVNGVQILDNISSLDVNNYTSVGYRLLEEVADAKGDLISYKRTTVDYETQKFGETVEMTKRLVVFDITLADTVDGKASTEEEALALLHNYNLSKLVENEDGTVDFAYDWYVFDRTPGATCGTMEPIYREKVGENTYRLAYLVDADQLEGEILFGDIEGHVYYAFTEKDLTK